MRGIAIAIGLALAACHAKPPGTPAPAASGGAGGASEAGNGGGLGEKNVLFVAREMGSLLDLCLGASYCGLTAEEQGLVRRVSAALRDRPVTDTQIAFGSAARDPELFHADGRAHGAVRSAVTSAHWGDRIWINLDHLYVRTSEGRGEPIGHPQIAALLLDELAHHVEPAFSQASEHRKLDVACAKLQTFLTARQDRPRLAGGGDVSITAVHFSDDSVLYPREGGFTQLLLSDGYELRDLTDEVRRLLRCPDRREQVKGWRIDNLHWHWPRSIEEERGFALEVDRRRGTSIVPLHGYVFTRCETQEYARRSYHLYVTLRFGQLLESERTGGRTVYWAAPPQLEMVVCTGNADPRCH